MSHTPFKKIELGTIKPIGESYTSTVSFPLPLPDMLASLSLLPEILSVK